MKSKTWILSLFTSVFLSCGVSENSIELTDNSNLERIVEQMEGELSALNTEIVGLKNYHEFLLENRESILANTKMDRYQFRNGKSTNRPGVDSDLSTILIMNKTPSYEEALQEIKLTNSLDSLFKAVKDKYDFVAQVYSNSSSYISRVYPAYDVEDLMINDVDVTTYNFYYEGNEENNPSRNYVWIPEAYVDPVGRGWILSIIQPVYDQDHLVTVLGIDITVNTIIDKFLSTDQENLIIATKTGDIVAASNSAIDALRFPPLKNHVYKETVQQDNFRISDYDLLNSKNLEVRKMADQMLLKDVPYFEFSEDYNLKSAKMIHFDLIDWVLIEVNPK